MAIQGNVGSAVGNGPLAEEVRRLSCERNSLSAIVSRLSPKEFEKWAEYTVKKQRRERAAFKKKLEAVEREQLSTGGS